MSESVLWKSLRKGVIMIRLGAIDVGTNSCRMLVVDYKNGEIKEIKRDLKITRLGEGVDHNKKLTERAINSALIAISSFVKEMRSLEVNQIKINGTSALRDVNNAHKLHDAVEKETGCKLDIISGEEEARLNYIGVASNNSDNLIIDIGGGSTEFIWLDNDRINYKSLDMGSVRMTERSISDSQKTVTQGELLAIEKDVKELINKIAGNISNIEKAIGLGGTITTIAAIDQGMTEYDHNKIQHYVLEIETIKRIRDLLRNKTLDQRKKVNGLQVGRADIIIPGIQILYVIMDILDIKEILVSEHDLLYGTIKEMGKWSLSGS